MQSNGERKLEYLLKEAEIPFIAEYSFPDLKSSSGHPLRFDYVIFDNFDCEGRPKACIEIQGAQHYEQRFQTAIQFARQQSNDKKKKGYCRAKGIPLVEIPYTDYNTMNIEDILERAHYFD